MLKQVVARHHAAREEGSAHPVVVAFGFEWVAVTLVRKDVQEHLAALAQPSMGARQKLFPVAHMLEHLNRDGAIKVAVGLKYVGVSSDHLQVFEPAFYGLLLDVVAAAALSWKLK